MHDLILIIGATGTVGREVARLTTPGIRVRALVRSQASATKLPRGVEPVFGDLGDPAALKRAFEGVRAALYVAPHDPNEETLTANVVTACNEAKARLVYVGVHADGGNRFSRAVQRFVYGHFLPHYAPKFRQSELVRQRVADSVILMPTNFFQNDELFREDIEKGRFPQPFAKPVNRVDVRDVAAAAMRALTDATVQAGAYPLCGPASVTGDECAAAWGAAVGHQVVVEEDQAKIDAAIVRALDEKKRDDFLKTYRVLRAFALPTDPKQLAATTSLLGRAPTSYEAYVRSVAASWKVDRLMTAG